MSQYKSNKARHANRAISNLPKSKVSPWNPNISDTTTLCENVLGSLELTYSLVDCKDFN